VLAAALMAVCGSGLVVLNQYLAQLVQNGPQPSGRNAIDPLSAYLRTSPARTCTCRTGESSGSLRLLNGGKLPLDPAPGEIAGDPRATPAPSKRWRLKTPFSSPTPENEVFDGDKGAHGRPGAIGRSSPRGPEADRRPPLSAIFQVYRYVAVAP